MSGELIVSSPDEITKEQLEAEATLLDSVVRETECEAITEREDFYEVIIDNGVEIESENFSIGKGRLQKKKTSNSVTLSQLLFTHTHTRPKVTPFNSDKVVFLRPIHS